MVEHTELKSIRENFVTIIYNGTNTQYTVLAKFGKIIAFGKDIIPENQISGEYR